MNLYLLLNSLDPENVYRLLFGLPTLLGEIGVGQESRDHQWIWFDLVDEQRPICTAIEMMMIQDVLQE